MLAAFQAVGLGGLRRLDSAEILACTRIAKNMSAIGYTGAEIALLLRALYLSASSKTSAPPRSITSPRIHPTDTETPQSPEGRESRTRAPLRSTHSLRR